MCMREKRVCRSNGSRFRTAQGVSGFSSLSLRFILERNKSEGEERTPVSRVLLLSALATITLSFLPSGESRDIIDLHQGNRSVPSQVHLPSHLSDSITTNSSTPFYNATANTHQRGSVQPRLSAAKRGARHKIRAATGIFSLYGINPVDDREHPLYGDIEQSEPCKCWETSADGHTIEVECKCTGPLVTELGTSLKQNALRNVYRITVDKATNFTTLANEDLKPYSNSLAEINFDQLPLFREIKPGTFVGMKRLDSIYIVETPSLTSIHPDVFNVFLPKLKSIRIVHSSMEAVPKLSELFVSSSLHIVDLENNKISTIEAGCLGNLEIEHLALGYNSLTYIGPSVFEGSTIAKLTLKGNRQLTTLHPDTFNGIKSLRQLDLSDTAITFLPVEGLRHLEILRVVDVPTLHVIPSIYRFDDLKEASLTWAYHCCAFEFPETHDPVYSKKYLEFVEKMDSKQCSTTNSQEAISTTPTSIAAEISTEESKTVENGHKSEAETPRRRQRHSTNVLGSLSAHSRRLRAASTSALVPSGSFNGNNNKIRSRNLHDGLGIAGGSNVDESHHFLQKDAISHRPVMNSFDPFALETDQSFGSVFEPSDTHSEGHHNEWSVEGSHHSAKGHDGEDFGHFHDDVTLPPPIISRCGNVSGRKTRKVNCKPYPDAFNPCEDIMGSLWLRGAVWVVVALALVGNTAVLVVLILAPGRMSVQRFLMANLSCADLCMGIYLLMVATQDLISLGAYFNFAIDWQLGWGCKIAGFLTVFASELSVFTLAVITGERWYALTRAIHLTKRLTIFGAAQLMSLGWLLAIGLATLPLVGVSSYSKTSICLPMDAESPGAQGYLAFLLCFNGIAFTLVACAYFQMYRAVAGHGTTCGSAPAAHSADAAIAKKMGLLVFTDFACWAPVAFFGLTAVAGSPLIGVTDSKILLVFFYPLNACCNPYLYAILTKQYRRDLLLLLSRHGLCTKRAARYKTGAASTNNTMQTMQTILRVGSVGETKVSTAKGARMSVASFTGVNGGIDRDRLSPVPDGAGFPNEEHPPPYSTLENTQFPQSTSEMTLEPLIKYSADKKHNGSPSFRGDKTNGKITAETSFVTLPTSTLDTNPKSYKNMRTGNEVTVEIKLLESTSGNARDVNTNNHKDANGKTCYPSFITPRDSQSSEEPEHEISERTPFCSTKQ